MTTSISARHLATVSSMRPGWMRPSLMSLVSAMRATSRRTGSKPDSTTASGVSSMIRSTPVACSRARMLRPSRPMMRPFISSDGSETTVTVASEVWSAAMRCMTVVRMRRARSLALVGGMALDLAHAMLRLGLRLVHDLLDQGLARLAGGETADPLQLRDLPLLQRHQADLLLLDLALPLLEAGLAALERLQLVVQALRPIEQQPLLALQVGSLLARLFLGGALCLEGVVLALEHDLLLLGARLGDDPLGVALGVLDR